MGLPELSNSGCLPGKAGGSPFCTRTWFSPIGKEFLLHVVHKALIQELVPCSPGLTPSRRPEIELPYSATGFRGGRSPGSEDTRLKFQ